MLISGTRFRYIYPQDTVNWLFNLRPVSTGIFNFNFHSNSGNIFNIFSIENRKIYSPSGDFIGSYETNSNLNLSGNISNNRIDLYNNANPLYLGLPIQNYDKITGFSLNSIGSQNVNFLNLSILGDTPEYFYDEKVSYRSGELIKINIINNSDYNFTIFSGIVTNNNFTVTGLNNLSIEQNNSGYFYLINRNNIISLSNTNIILDTDFGTQELRVTLSGIRLEDETYYLSFGPNILYVENNYYKDYNIVFRNADSANLSIQLKYISGLTGDYYRNVQRTAFVTNQNVSGFITGSGFLSSNVSGFVSGFNLLRNYYEYGTGSGIVREFKVAEDQYIEKNYTVLGSGLGNIFTLTNIGAKGFQPDILYTGFLNFNGGFLTGFFSGIVTGIVPDERRGWYLDTNGNFVPPPISEENYNTICNANPSNSICSQYSFVYEYKTGLKTGLVSKFFINTGDIFVEFDPSDYENINLISPLIFVTGKISGFFNITGAAFATGSRISGKLIGDYQFNFEPGIWNISKSHVGIITGESFLNWDVSGKGFDPIKGEPIYEITSGNFSGKVSLVTGLDFCNPVIPGQLPITDIPEFVGKNLCFSNDDIYFFQYSGFVIQPLSGEEKFFENSFFQIASGSYQLYPGHPTGGRTRISRLGQTSSGSGKFYNLFEGIGFELPSGYEQKGNLNGISAFAQYNGGGWEENFLSLNTFRVFDSGIPPSITDIDIECNILYPCDTTIIGFTIEPPNFYNFRGTDVQDCWSGCFSHWPRKLSSIESSGNIISLDTQSIFTSDGFNTSSEFYICDIDLILSSSSSSSSSTIFSSSSSSSFTSSSSSSLRRCDNAQFIADMFSLLLYRQPTNEEFITWSAILGASTSPGQTLAPISNRADMVMNIMGYSNPSPGNAVSGRFSYLGDYQSTAGIALQTYARLSITPSSFFVNSFLNKLRSNTEILPLPGTFCGVNNAPWGASYGLISGLQEIIDLPIFETRHPGVRSLPNNQFILWMMGLDANANLLPAPTLPTYRYMFTTTLCGAEPIQLLMTTFVPQTSKQGAGMAYAMKYILARNNFVNGPDPLAFPIGGTSEMEFQLRANAAALKFQLNGSDSNSWDYNAAFEISNTYYSKTLVEEYLQIYWDDFCPSDGQFMSAISSNLIYTSYDYGTTWVDRTNNYPYSGLRGIDISSKGRYQVVADYPNKIFISNNSGVAWSPVSFNGQNRGCQSIAISANGKYQAALLSSREDPIFGSSFVDPNPELIVSTDFGQTWVSKLAGNWTDVAISNNGRYITVVSFTGGPCNNCKGIYVSNDYGQTWTEVIGAGSWFRVSMSDNGQYQTVAGINSQLLVSNNFGVTWFNKDSVRTWYDVSVGGDGRYQAAAVYQNSDRGIYISSDYGQTWTQKLQPTFDLERYGTVAISSDGKYIAVGRNGLSVLLSEDFGETWRLTATSSAGWEDISIK